MSALWRDKTRRIKLELPPRHVRAWYCYAFAAEVFAACAMVCLDLPGSSEN